MPDEPTELLSDVLPDLETDVAGEATLSAWLWPAVERLSEPHRSVILLCYRDGMTHSQAGKLMGYEKSWIGLVRSEALEALRGMLE